jgi:hypothetical protein
VFLCLSQIKKKHKVKIRVFVEGQQWQQMWKVLLNHFSHFNTHTRVECDKLAKSDFLNKKSEKCKK